MRKQFVKTLQKILHCDLSTVLLLGDIGVYGFREELKNLPKRVYNIGILEQTTISLSAGMSRSGLIPFIHTISPFMVERALEQIKIDFAYQNLTGNFISVGNSYDYASLGCTHHCPGDVQILMSIPDIKIFCPGTSLELDYLIQSNYNKGVNYYRMSEYENDKSYLISKASVIKSGSKATILCFGNKLNEVISSCNDLDVTILYYNSIQPFDFETLQKFYNKKIIVVEPFYEGSVNNLIVESLRGLDLQIYNIGVPRKFLTNYGSKEEHDKYLKIDSIGIGKKIRTICEEN